MGAHIGGRWYGGVKGLEYWEFLEWCKGNGIPNIAEIQKAIQVYLDSKKDWVSPENSLKIANRAMPIAERDEEK